MPLPLSAIDAISPAFDRTKRELFQPFRLAFWARMALVALVTGEFYGSGGWSGFHFAVPSSRRGPGHISLGLVNPRWQYLMQYLPWIVGGALLLVALLIFWAYASSVFRFILFDSVLTDRCRIKEAWHHWQSQGISFFLWRICLGLAFGVVLAVLSGVAILVVVKTGAIVNPRQHLALLILGGLVAFLVLACLAILTALIALFARDFVVPVMALEDVGVIEGWRRVIPMLKAEKGAYAGYVLMKIVLVVGSAILFGILTLAAMFLLLIPLSVAGYGAYSMAKSAQLLWHAPAIAIAAVIATVALAAIFYVVSFVSAPAMVFFQAYVIDFLGSRYPTLGDRLSPPPTAPSFPDTSPSPAD